MTIRYLVSDDATPILGSPHQVFLDLWPFLCGQFFTNFDTKIDDEIESESVVTMLLTFDLSASKKVPQILFEIFYDILLI